MPILNLDKPVARDAEGSGGLQQLHTTLKAAIAAGASDIHLQPEGDHMRVRFRIDGQLQDINPSILVALEAKVIAALINQTESMRIDEYRHPQDGRVFVEYQGGRYDLRINIAPVQTGSNDAISRRGATIRLLSVASIVGGLPTLGFTAETITAIRKITGHPHGMFLVTGPTGSGKSTTLASVMRELNVPTRKIISVEDPVEYTIPGVEQMEVHAKGEFTFASALRSILRRDPDVIMVGEIRDPETAKMAINASLTGHLVLSTLHTNDAPTATERLIDLGVEHYLLADILVGVLAQRLVRKICSKCKTERTLSPDDINRLAAVPTSGQAATLWKGQGCKDCNNTGYKGRMAIHEMLVVDPDLIRLIARRAPLLEVREAAARAGMRTMYDDGITKALAGQTTIEEVLANARHD